MWLVDFLPDWIFSALFALSIVILLASFLVGKLPVISSYILPIRIVFVIVAMACVWFMGGIAKDEEWKQRVAEMEQKVAQSEVKSAEQNIKIVTKIVTKTKIVKQRSETIVKYIDKEIVKYDSKCEIPKEFIDVLNEAAGDPK